jgi:hypothetical protein
VVALPVATVLLWNRLRGPRPVRGAQRLGLIVLCQSTAVLLAALLINNSFQLYTSWSDLFGWNGAPGQIEGAAKPLALATGAAQTGQPTGDRALPNAALFHPYHGVANAFETTITGTQSKVTGTVLVWLPPQYYQPRYAHTYFPVVQLFSGFPGSPQTWLSGMAAPSILSRRPAGGDLAHPGRPPTRRDLLPHRGRPHRLGLDGLLRRRPVRLEARASVPGRVHRGRVHERRRPPRRRPA